MAPLAESARAAVSVLADLAEHRARLGGAGRQTVLDRYALDVTFLRLAALFEGVARDETDR